MGVRCHTVSMSSCTAGAPEPTNAMSSNCGWPLYPAAESRCQNCAPVNIEHDMTSTCGLDTHIASPWLASKYAQWLDAAVSRASTSVAQGMPMAARTSFSLVIAAAACAGGLPDGG